MSDATSTRAWTCVCGGSACRGGAAAANRRIAASSVAPIFQPISTLPASLRCSLRNRPGHHGDVASIIWPATGTACLRSGAHRVVGADELLEPAGRELLSRCEERDLHDARCAADLDRAGDRRPVLDLGDG